jgi:hypothetical protein
LVSAGDTSLAPSPSCEPPLGYVGTIAIDGERSCDLVDAGDRFDVSPRQTRAIAWAT